MNERDVRLEDMRVDLSYQREADATRVRGIASKWDDMKANLIHVSHRPDGFYYIMDGNHTKEAAQIVGKKKLLCRIYEGLTVEDEAKIFTELNTSQKKPSFNQMLIAKARAGYEKEKTYIQLLQQSNIPYSLGNSGAVGKIRCHSALFAVYRGAGYQLMLRAIKTAMQAAEGRDEFYQVGFFPGLCSLIVHHPEIDDVRLIKVIKKTTSSKIREIAEKYRRGAVSGTNSATMCFRKAYADIYNSGLKKNRIEE